MRIFVVAVSFAAVLGISLLGQQQHQVDDAALRNAAASGDEWLTTGRDYAESHFSPLRQITSANVSRLGLAWTYNTDSLRGLEATPLISNGVLYGTTSWSAVFAVDARSGKFKWRWDPEVSRAIGGKACCDVVNRGVALYQDKVFVGVLDGRLAALNAETGKVVWQVQTTDPNQGYTITGAPRVVKGNVIIGNGGAEMGVRGYVSAYNAQTGKMAWRFYIVPGDPSKPFENKAMEEAAKTWTGQWWKGGGGGTPWDAFAYDPDANLLYVGTGNGSPWNREIRSPGGGDNLYLSSILALRPETGELVWHYQTTPGDSWDFTAVQHMILTELTIGGRTRKVLMQAPKNGFFYVVDRITGELISAEPYAKINWATGVDKKTGRPIEVPEARYKHGVSLLTPGPAGAHNWQPMSFNPATGLVYIPAQDGSFPYAQDSEFKYRQGTWNLGVDFNARPQPVQPPQPKGAMPGYLLAWDPVAQKERWRVPYSIGSNGGTLTTAGNLVFQGTADGRFVAYSADKGQKLWDVKLGTGIIAAPATYQLDGKQYVSVLAGWGGASALFGANASGSYKAEGRVWTFVLDGANNIQPVSSRPRPALTSIAHEASPATLAKGQNLFGESCAMCHGGGAVSGGTIADLRYASAATFQNFRGIVLDGNYLSLGMPSFKQWRSPDDVDAIRLYVLSQRAQLIRERSNDTRK